jgi:hypothetical protein
VALGARGEHDVLLPRLHLFQGRWLRPCSGQVISDTTIGFFAAMFRSKTEGGRLPNTECRRTQL